MTQFSLISYIRDAGINCVISPLANAEYDPIDFNYVSQVCSAWVDSLDPALKVSVETSPGIFQWQPKYLLPSFDCAQMSFSFTNAMILGSALAAAKEAGGGKPVRNAPAFGYLYYIIGKGGYMGDSNATDAHSICWFLDFSNKIHYFEKQNGNEVSLTTGEVASIFSIIAA